MVVTCAAIVLVAIVITGVFLQQTQKGSRNDSFAEQPQDKLDATNVHTNDGELKRISVDDVFVDCPESWLVTDMSSDSERIKGKYSYPPFGGLLMIQDDRSSPSDQSFSEMQARLEPDAANALIEDYKDDFIRGAESADGIGVDVDDDAVLVATNNEFIRFRAPIRISLDMEYRGYMDVIMDGTRAVSVVVVVPESMADESGELMRRILDSFGIENAIMPSINWPTPTASF